MAERDERFLSRWARLKQKAAHEAPASERTPATPDTARDAPPALPPLEKLTLESDYTGFFHPKVDDNLRRDFKRDETVADLDDLACYTAGGDDFIALLQRFDHLALFLGLLHLRADEHEPEQHENDDQGKKTGPVRSGCRRGCGVSVADKHGKSF